MAIWLRDGITDDDEVIAQERPRFLGQWWDWTRKEMIDVVEMKLPITV